MLHVIVYFGESWDKFYGGGITMLTITVKQALAIGYIRPFGVFRPRLSITDNIKDLQSNSDTMIAFRHRRKAATTTIALCPSFVFEESALNF